MNFKIGVFQRYAVVCVMLSLLLTSGCADLGLNIPTVEPVTLKFGYFKGIADYDTLVNEFEKQHPDIQIELVDLQGDALYRGLDEEIDTFRWDVSNFSPEVVQNLLKLDDFLSDGSVKEQDFYPGTLEALKFEGKQVGLPAGINLYVAYANTEAFEKMGVSVPPANWTIDDFLAAASGVNFQQGNFTDSDFTFGYCSSPDSFDPLIFTYIQGGAIFDQLPAPTKVTLNDPQNAAALQWYANLKLEYGVLSDPDVIVKAFGSKNISLAIMGKKCGLWLGTYSDLFQQTWGKWDVRPTMLPLPGGSADFNVGNLDGYFILASSKHPKEAYQWISFLAQQPGAEGVLMPARLSRIQSDQYAQQVGADVAETANNLPEHLILMTPQLGDFRVLERIISKYSRAVQYVVQGDLDASSALQEAQDSVENLIQ